jgi:very-short-patch-repair endonuclease
MQGSKNAKLLRQRQTDAEQLLWYRLRSRRLDGFKFRRQMPIDPYIVDFVFMSARLIVELDGGQHAAVTSKDESRTKILRREGYAVIRFWNNEVLLNLDGVLTVILETLKRRETPSP